MGDTPPLPELLETERLFLRPIVRADLDFFVALHGDRDVVRFLGGDGTPRTPEVTERWLARMIRWYGEQHVGPYAIVRREDETLVGRGGLSFFEIEKIPSRPDGVPVASWGRGSARAGVEVDALLEIGYVVDPRQWGHGYATEAAERWYRYAFEERGEPVVHSIIHDENVGSLRVAEKNGLRAGGTVSLDEREYRIYRLAREERDGG